MDNLNNITGAVSTRERALLDALQAIVMETMDCPIDHPISNDSYLPEKLIGQAQAALACYGLALHGNETASEVYA